MRAHASSLVLIAAGHLLLCSIASCEQRLHFVTPPQSTDAPVNTTLSLRCACAYSGFSPAVSETAFSIDWLKNNVFLSEIDDPLTEIAPFAPDWKDSIGSVLTILSAQSYHSGTYGCVCHSRVHRPVEPAIATAVVHVVQKPSVVIERRVTPNKWVAMATNSSLEAEKDSTFALRCRHKSVSSGLSRFQWFFDGTLESQTDEKASELVIGRYGVVERDAGLYSCVATSDFGLGTSSANLLLTVSKQVPRVRLGPHGDTRREAVETSLVGPNYAVLKVGPHLMNDTVCYSRVSDGRVSRALIDAPHVLLPRLDVSTEYSAWVAEKTCDEAVSDRLQFHTRRKQAPKNGLNPAPIPTPIPRPHTLTLLGGKENNRTRAQTPTPLSLSVVATSDTHQQTVTWSIATGQQCLFFEINSEHYSNSLRRLDRHKYLRSGIERKLRVYVPEDECSSLTVVCRNDHETILSDPLRLCANTHRRFRRDATAVDTKNLTESAVETGDGIGIGIGNGGNQTTGTLENVDFGIEEEDEVSADDLAKPIWDRVEVNSTSVHLSWFHRGNGTAGVEYWDVRYGKFDPNDRNISVRQPFCTVTGLQQGNTYVFAVSACNQGVCGQPIYESVAIERDDYEEDSALSPPLEVMAVAVAPTTILVTWVDQNSARFKDSRYYTVRYAPVAQRTGTNGEAVGRTGPGEYLDAPPVDRLDNRAKPDRQRFVNVTDTQLTVNTLRPFTEYEFEICVNKGTKRSGWSMKAHNRTLEAAPTQAPLDLQASIVNDGQHVELRWRPVPSRHQNGVIRTYQVAYSTNEQYPDSRWTTESINGTLLSYVVRNVLPGIGYYFKVRAKTIPRGGYGPFSNTAYAETAAASNGESPQIPIPIPGPLSPDESDPAHPAVSTPLLIATARQDDGKVHDITIETWYIIIGCSAGVTIVIVVVVTVSVVKKRRRTVEIQRRKAACTNKRFAGSQIANGHNTASTQPPAVSSQGTTNRPSTVSVQYPGAQYQYSPLKHKTNEHPAPTVRFNVHYNEVQQVTPLGSPTYSSSDCPQSLPEPPGLYNRGMQPLQVAKINGYEQPMTSYCSVDASTSNGGRCLHPQPQPQPQPHPVRNVRVAAQEIPTATPQSSRRGWNNTEHQSRFSEDGRYSESDVSSSSHNAAATHRPNRCMRPNEMDYEAYNASMRYPSRGDSSIDRSLRPDADTNSSSVSAQVVHPVPPYRVVETQRKTIEPSIPVPMPPKAQHRKTSDESSGDRNNNDVDAPGTSASLGVVHEQQKAPLILANLTVEPAEDCDVPIKFIPVVKINLSELKNNANSNVNRVETLPLMSDCSAQATSSGIASQLSSHSHTSSNNSTGAARDRDRDQAQVHGMGLHTSPRSTSDETTPDADVAQHVVAASTLQKACCAKTCTYCCADSNTHGSPSHSRKCACGHQCPPGSPSATKQCDSPRYRLTMTSTHSGSSVLSSGWLTNQLENIESLLNDLSTTTTLNGSNKSLSLSLAPRVSLARELVRPNHRIDRKLPFKPTNGQYINL